MKLPPNQPPNPPPSDPKAKQGSGKSSSAASDWGDALDDRAQQTVSPDVVRKLLEMNPALRESGMTTNAMVNQAKKAHAQAASGQRGAANTTAAPVDDIFTVLGDWKRELAVEQQRIDTEIERLNKQRKEVAALTKEKMMRWLGANDPDMRSPVTQQVLEQEKPFLDQLGFSVKEYVARRLKK